jgi:hypothetical protein
VSAGALVENSGQYRNGPWNASAFEGVVGHFDVPAVVAMLVGRFLSRAMEKDGR